MCTVGQMSSSHAVRQLLATLAMLLTTLIWNNSGTAWYFTFFNTESIGRTIVHAPNLIALANLIA